MRRLLAAVLIAIASLALLAPQASAAQRYATATFRPGSGNYLTTPGGRGTDNLRQVGGQVTFTRSATPPLLRAYGSVTGLAPGTPYVAVAYKDAYCLPTPGITAFPSGTFVTNANGAATFDLTVNPQGVNPVGKVRTREIRSVSIRAVVVPGVTVPGVPVGTPTLPNILAVEGCDRRPVIVRR